MLLTDDQGFKLFKCMDSSVIFEAAHVCTVQLWGMVDLFFLWFDVHVV